MLSVVLYRIDVWLKIMVSSRARPICKDLIQNDFEDTIIFVKLKDVVGGGGGGGVHSA